jgi:hypothetical protein
MALPTPHFFQIKHPPGVVADVQVNDVPFYRRYSELHQAPAGPVNHLLLEGENTVTIRLAEAHPDPMRISSFEVSFLRESDKKVLFRRRWPDFAELHPEEERQLPVVHHAVFRFDEPTPRALWADAPVESFPLEGTAELHDALRALHDAYARADVDAFLSAMEHKTADFVKFYGPLPELEPQVARGTYGERLRQPWELDPYDPTKIVFERRAGGRAAYATSKEGGPALFAKHKLDPAETWEASPLLARVDGRWRIIW